MKTVCVCVRASVRPCVVYAYVVAWCVHVRTCMCSCLRVCSFIHSIASSCDASVVTHVVLRHLPPVQSLYFPWHRHQIKGTNGF